MNKKQHMRSGVLERSLWLSARQLYPSRTWRALFVFPARQSVFPPAAVSARAPFSEASRSLARSFSAPWAAVPALKKSWVTPLSGWRMTGSSGLTSLTCKANRPDMTCGVGHFSVFPCFPGLTPPVFSHSGPCFFFFFFFVKVPEGDFSLGR